MVFLVIMATQVVAVYLLNFLHKPHEVPYKNLEPENEFIIPYSVTYWLCES